MKRIVSLLAVLLICATSLIVSCNKPDNERPVKIVTVKSGDDLQMAIYNADVGTEIRVEACASFDGPIYLRDSIKVSGGWVDDFKSQDLDNRSIIDGKGTVQCVISGVMNDKWIGADDAAISGFEIRNSNGPGIFYMGKLTVEYCWIHNCINNSGQGGALSNKEEPGDDLLLANSIIEYNEADAHGGAVGIGGKDTKMTIVNCLIRGNASIAQYGYTGAIHGQAGVHAYLVNNTIVDNVNWRDGSSITSTPWSAVMFRNGGTHIVMINNIVAGNWYFLPGVASNPANTDRYTMPINPKYYLEMQCYSVDLNVIGGDDLDWVCQSNLLGGIDENRFIYRAGTDEAREAAQKACTFVANKDFKTIFVDAEGGNYHPAGPALEVGESSELVNTLLGKYKTDLAGKPRSSGGKIVAGCYQPL